MVIKHTIPFFIAILSIVMLIVVMLNVIMLSVISPVYYN